MTLVPLNAERGKNEGRQRSMTYLFAAYTAIWVLIFGYTLTLGRREKQLQEELFLLKKVMEKK